MQKGSRTPNDLFFKVFQKRLKKIRRWEPMNRWLSLNQRLEALLLANLELEASTRSVSLLVQQSVLELISIRDMSLHIPLGETYSTNRNQELE